MGKFPGCPGPLVLLSSQRIQRQLKRSGDLSSLIIAYSQSIVVLVWSEQYWKY